MPTFIERLADGWRAREIGPEPPPGPPPVVQGYYAGLDLGQAQDLSALTVLEARRPGGDDDPMDSRPVYHCRELRRWRKGTSYVDVCQDVARLLARPPLWGQTTLLADATGVGAPVVDILHRLGLSRELVAVTLTGGQGFVRAGPSEYHLSKVELVSTAQVCLQSRRLRISPKLAEAPTLIKELEGYQVRIGAQGRESFGAWREGQHDDLLLACCLAVWGAEQFIGAPTRCY